MTALGTRRRELWWQMVAIAAALLVALVAAVGWPDQAGAGSTAPVSDRSAGGVMARSDGGCETCHTQGAGGFVG